MKFFSHDKPKRLIKDHLQEVSCRMEEFILQTPLTKDKKLIPEIAILIGVGHDFGKYTTFFQKSLLQGIESSKANHGFISAVFTFYLVDKFVEEVDKKYLALIAYSSVLHHHGNLENLSDDCNFDKEKGNYRKNILNAQLKDIQENKVDIERDYQGLDIDLDLQEFISQKDSLIKEISDRAYLYDYYLDDSEKEYYFSLMLFLYSSLIDADKKEAGQITSIPRRELPANLVDRYIEREFSDADNTRINRLRNAVYKNAMQNVESLSLDEHILTLTAPTGSGKTLTSFSVALKLRKKIENKKGYSPRIIYSLPFTSIIDQNYENLAKVLSQIENFAENKGNYLIKHHHLADINYKYEGRNKERPLDEALQLIESWESEVIVTTFVQLLHTILGYKNSFLKKLHNLTGSIILLDEVQNIPAEYWPLVRKAMLLLARYYNTYIILMTATKPLIFSDDETTSLINDYEKYFEDLSRTKLVVDTEEKEVPDFVEDFISRFQKDKSYLIVMNTISSSLKVYHNLKEWLDSGEMDIIYLSSNIYPRERRERIENIKQRLDSGEKMIVVSTQVVEAGVDIDMDVVYRDLGPVDSIVQVAGRGNREWDKQDSLVYVYNLKGKNRPFAVSVYGSIHYSRSLDILKGFKEVRESRYYQLVYDYFNNIKSAIEEADDSRKIIKAMQGLSYKSDQSTSVSDFKLIEDKYNYVDLFVEETKEAEEVWERFIEDVYNKRVKNLTDYREKREAYLEIKNIFQSYIISVPAKLVKPYISEDDYYNGVFKPSCDVKHFYNRNTGFKWEIDEDEDLDNRML